MPENSYKFPLLKIGVWCSSEEYTHVQEILSNAGCETFRINKPCSKRCEHSHFQSLVICYDRVRTAIEPYNPSKFNQLLAQFGTSKCILFNHKLEVSIDTIDRLHQAGIILIHESKLAELPSRLNRIFDCHREQFILSNRSPEKRWDEFGDILSDDDFWILRNLLPYHSEEEQTQHFERSIRLAHIFNCDKTDHEIAFKATLLNRDIPVVIKIAGKEKINTEYNNYWKNVHLRLDNYPYLEKRFIWGDLGGLLYTFLGTFNASVTFSSYFKKITKENTQKIEQTLKVLFLAHLKPYYVAKERLSDPIYTYYDSIYHLSEKISDRTHQIDLSFLNNLELVEKNPIRWLGIHKADSALINEGILLNIARTHGDLWGENILSFNENVWLIDFYRTEMGFSYRDFIELEIDIFTRLIDPKFDECIDTDELTNEEIKTLHMLLAFLFGKELRIKKTITGLPNEIQNVVNAIQLIRQYAEEIIAEKDPRPYYWGLLINSIYQAFREGSKYSQKQRALLYAGAICYQLEHWEKPIEINKLELNPEKQNDPKNQTGVRL